MTDRGDHGSPESHGVYGGTPREDGEMQEEPGGADASAGSGSGGTDEREWAEKTETGGDAT